MLNETLMDFAGLDYDAANRVLELQPTLPQSWPKVGMSRQFPCGSVSYKLARSPANGTYVLILDADLKYDVTVKVDVTCHGLNVLNFGKALIHGQPPAFDRATGRLTWTMTLEAGITHAEWDWG